MGWDIVQIGLRHNLPINDPYAIAEKISKRMNRNVRLVYKNDFEYDVMNNAVCESKGHSLVELGRFDVDSSGNYLQLIICNYQANQILEVVGIENIRKASCKNEYGRWLLDDIENPYILYEIEDNNLCIKIYKENVELCVDMYKRWSYLERAFHLSTSQNIEMLHNYRMQIYNQAQMFGCNEVIICADQGPGECIYNYLNYSADSLKEYISSFQYIKDYGVDVDKWNKHARHINFSSIFQNNLILSRGDFIEVIYDDFE